MDTINHILLPTDFSDNARHAYQYAFQIAKKTGAKVSFLLAVEEPYDFATRVEEKMSVLTDFAHQQFEQLTAKYSGLEEYEDVDMDYHVVKGKTVTNILRASEEWDTDLIVMGTKGASGLKKVLYGSNASEVVSHSEIPVMVIPNNSSYDDFEDIVFATDYQQNDLDLLETTIEFASHWNSMIHILHISEKADLRSEIMFRGFRELVNAELEYGHLDFNIEYSDNFFEGIAEYQDPEKSSLLVLGKYKTHFIEELLTRSATKQLSFYSEIPLLVLPS